MKKWELVLQNVFIENMLVVPSTTYFTEKKSAHPALWNLTKGNGYGN